MKGKIETITHKEAVSFLLPRHYSGRIPSISWAFGWYVEDELVAVLTVGKPASNSLCEGVMGKDMKEKVYELNRLCRVDGLELQLSQFVTGCLRRLRPYEIVVVSYSDTGMKHNGYIYQACNFLYTGQTKERTDKWTEGNKHSRHYSNEKQGEYRKVRSAKNRYVYFAVSNRTVKKKYLALLKYPILSYPKAENSNYILGNYQETKLVKITK